jgi:autotransporter-associated beta strand protein
MHPNTQAGIRNMIAFSAAFCAISQPACALTWSLAGSNASWPADKRNAIIAAMNEAVAIYNANGHFDKHVWANYDPGVPTAQASYGGWIDFGGSISRQVAMHEISHTLGVGQVAAWNTNRSGNLWTGPRALARVRLFDGPSAVLNADSIHFWPYGLNYSSEDTATNRVRHVKMVSALRWDLGIVNDNDGDGMPSDWENFWFGNLAQTGTDDFDKDGVNNLAEYNADTNPARVFSFTWKGGAGAWDTTTTNWSGAATRWRNGGSDQATFGGAAGVVTPVAGVSANRLVFNSSLYQIGGGEPVTLTGSGPSISTAAANSITVDTPLAGAAGLRKQGAGTLILTGVNTYSGATHIEEGTLEVASSGRLLMNGGAGLLTIGNGAALSFTGNWGWDGTLRYQGVRAADNLIDGGTLRRYGSSGNPKTSAGAGRLFTIGANGATLESATAGREFSIGYRYDYSDSLASEGGDLTLSGEGNGDLNYRLPGTGGLVKTGPGTWKLTGSDNTFSGPTVVEGGTLIVGKSGTHPTTGVLENSASLTIRTGGTVSALGSDTFKGTDGGDLTVNLEGGTLRAEDGTHTLGALKLAGGELTGSGDPATGSFVFKANLTVTEDSAITALRTSTAGAARTIAVAPGRTLDWTGTLRDDEAGPSSLIIRGSGGTVVFSGNNTHTGGTTIGSNNNTGSHGGTVRAESSAAFGSGPLSVIAGDTTNTSSGCQLQLVGGITLAQPSVTVSGLGNGAANGVIASLGGNNSITGPLRLTDGAGGTVIACESGSLTLGDITTIRASRTLELTGAGDIMISGAISNGSTAALPVTKSGAGTLTLAGTNTHSGATTVTGGTLRADGTLAGSAVSVASGATLTGIGRTGPTTIEAGGIISPAGEGTGTLTTGSLVLHPGSFCHIHLGSQSDRIQVSGSLTLGGTIDLRDTGSAIQGVHVLMTHTGTLSGSAMLLPPTGFFAVLDISTPGVVAVNLTADRYETWARSGFSAADLTNAAISGPLATPAGDGMTNLMKYALGLPPKQPATEDIGLVREGQVWSMTYHRPARRSDLTYAVETTTSPGSQPWTSSGVTHQRTATGDPESWKGSVSADSSRSFLRLRVERR